MSKLEDNPIVGVYEHLLANVIFNYDADYVRSSNFFSKEALIDIFLREISQMGTAWCEHYHNVSVDAKVVNGNLQINIEIR